MALRPETKEAVDVIVDTITGGADYVIFLQKLEQWDRLASKEGNSGAKEIIKVVTKFSRLVKILTRQ